MAMVNASVCTTAACTRAGQAMVGYMATNFTKIDPCGPSWDNYICQGFRDKHRAAIAAGGAGVYDEISQYVMQVLGNVLNGSYPRESDHSSFSPRNLIEVRATIDEQNFDKLKTFYNSCMDTDTITKIGVKPIVDLVTEFTKVFPVDDAAWASNAPLSAADSNMFGDALAFSEKLGIETFFSSFVGADDLDPNKNILFFTPPEAMSLPSNEFYASKDVTDMYHTVLSSVFNRTLTSAAARAVSSQIADDIIAMEKKIVEIIPPLEDQRNVKLYYNPSNLTATAALAPIMGLERYFASVAPAGYNFSYMITSFPDYFKKVNDILITTPKRSVQAYFAWQLISTTRGFVLAPEVEIINRFSRILNGQNPNTTTLRWRTCHSSTSRALSFLLGRFFVESAFSEKAKALGDQIVTDLKAEFIRRIEASTWMDDATRKAAIDKVNRLRSKIGYPTKSPNIMDPASLQDWYKDLDITTSYFNNGINHRRWSSKRAWEDLTKPVDRDEWSMPPQTINAYYNPSGNEIAFPAAIMQFPMFDADTPDYVSYGGFGSVVGHEISHGFDMMGRQYDGQGYLKDWWTPETSAEFERRAKCFVEEYENFTVIAPGTGQVVRGNGELALGENIADSGGVEIAFGAWKARDAKNPNQKLPGLEGFTNEQSFFLWRSPFFCSGVPVEYDIQLMLSDPHPPDRYRTVAPNLNSREFLAAFQCAQKEPTCELW